MLALLMIASCAMVNKPFRSRCQRADRPHCDLIDCLVPSPTVRNLILLLWTLKWILYKGEKEELSCIFNRLHIHLLSKHLLKVNCMLGLTVVYGGASV